MHFGPGGKCENAQRRFSHDEKLRKHAEEEIKKLSHKKDPRPQGKAKAAGKAK
jgi:hypothetical protein